jgi:ribosomal 30S subunit maturation factor RimM
MKAGDWVYLGYVERAHGLRGRIVARLVLAGPAGTLETGTLLRLDGTESRILRSSVKDSLRITLQLEGFHNREQADRLRGASIFIQRASISPGSGPLPLHAYVGMEVRSGGFSGEVSGVEALQANPCLLVDGGSGTFPVPLTMVAAGETDWDSGVITVDLPEGLQEMVVES